MKNWQIRSILLVKRRSGRPCEQLCNNPIVRITSTKYTKSLHARIVGGPLVIVCNAIMGRLNRQIHLASSQ